MISSNEIKITIVYINYFKFISEITVIPFVIFPPKSDDFTDFCEGENDNGQQKIFEKLFWKFYLILLKLYSKIHNFLNILCLNFGGGKWQRTNFFSKNFLEGGGNDKGGKMTEGITVFEISTIINENIYINTKVSIVKLFQSNWNNKILRIENGVQPTVSLLVRTSRECFAIASCFSILKITVIISSSKFFTDIHLCRLATITQEV